MRVVGLILAAVAAVLLFAGLRPELERLVQAVVGLPAALLAAVRDAARGAGAGVRGVVERSRAALAHGPETPGVAPAWDVVAPLVYLVLLVVLFGGDVVLASLRFGALLGLPVDTLPVDGSVLDLLTGLLFLAVLATYGCVLLDVIHVTPLRRPYGLATGNARTSLVAVATAGVALSALAGVLFFVWGQYAIFGEPSQDIATLFIAVFALLLVGASVLAAGGALGCVLALWVLVGVLAATVLDMLAALADLLGTVLGRVSAVLVALVRLLARPGSMLWNWLAELPVGRALHLRRLLDPEPPTTAAGPRDERDHVELVGGP